MEHFNKISLIKDFPEPGIYFRHIGPLLNDCVALKEVLQVLVKRNTLNSIDVIAGLDARGFILSTGFQFLVEKPQVMIRKASKTPGETYSCTYSREYGKECTVELEKGLIKPGQNVLIVDDLLATGGTMIAAARLIKQAGGNPISFITIIELLGLPGRSLIEKEFLGVRIDSLFKYDVDSSSTVPIVKNVTLFNATTRRSVYVCSESISKLQAVKNVFPYDNVYSVSNCKSGIPEQPIGYLQTEEGLKNRLQDFLKMGIHDDDSIVISIENGIIFYDDVPYDVPLVGMFTKTNGLSTYTGSYVEGCVSLKEYTDILKDWNQDSTFGSFIEKKYNLQKDQWYTYLGHPSRETIITGTLKNVLDNYGTYEDID